MRLPSRIPVCLGTLALGLGSNLVVPQASGQITLIAQVQKMEVPAPVQMIEIRTEAVRAVAARPVRAFDLSRPRDLDDKERANQAMEALLAPIKAVVADRDPKPNPGRPVNAQPAEAAVAMKRAQIQLNNVVVGRRARIVNGQNLDPFIAQFTQQFKTVMLSEQHFIRKVCEPDADQRKILAEKGEPALKELATRFGKLQQQMNMGQMPGVIPDPRTVIEEIFLEMLKPGFNEAQLARYGDEITKRKENLKTIAVSNLVARLDQDLILTVEQREKITAELTANWKDNWCQSLDYIQYFDRYFPDIPDRFVSSHLDDMQKVLYHKIPKNQRIFLGIGNPRQIQIAESAFQEEDSDVKPPSPNAAR